MSFVRTYILYVPKDSIIHRLDPVTKLVILFTLSLQAVIVTEPVSGMLIFAASITIYLAAKLPKKILLEFLRYWLFMFAFAFVSYGWSYRDKGTCILEFGWFHLTDIAVLLTVTIIFRLLSLLTLGLMLYCSTTQRDIITGFRKLKVPYVATFVFALAIRSLSILYDDYRRIRDAQMARALEFERGNFLERLKKMVLLLAPLIVVALNRVGTMSSSIEARGFKVRDKKRTFYYSTKMRPIDYAVSSILLGETAVVVALNILYGYFTISWLLLHTM